MKNIPIILIVVLFTSCGSGKYSYLFDTGRQLDFNEGKWIINQTASNSIVFDRELNTVAYSEFREIIRDSLYDLNSLRANKLVAPKIEFELDTGELQELGQDTGCDYLINVRGDIISNGAGTVSFNSGGGYYSASNQSSVSIIIYHLNSGTIISSSQVIAKDTAENTHFDDDKGIPTIRTSAETLMLKAAKKLVKKYNVYRLNK